MSDELKPCPFCGGSDIRFAYIGRESNPKGAPSEAYTFSQHAECRTCGLSTGRATRVCSVDKNATLYHAHLKAVEMWNTRAQPSDGALTNEGVEPVAFHMGDAMILEKLLKLNEVSRHIRGEKLGPIGATIVTEYTTKVGLRLITECSNGGCSAYIYPPARASVVHQDVVLREQLMEIRRQFERANFVKVGNLINACLDRVKELNS